MHSPDNCLHICRDTDRQVGAAELQPQNFAKQNFVLCLYLVRGPNKLWYALSLPMPLVAALRSFKCHQIFPCRENLVGPEGLEPSTPVLSGLCSNQLSYGPEFKCIAFRCNALIHYLPAGRQARYTINRKPLTRVDLFRDAPNLISA